MLVIGVGEMGSAVVDVLWEGGAEVVVLDVSPDAVEDCRSRWCGSASARSSRGVKPGSPGATMQLVEPNYRLLEGDTLLLVGPASGIDAFLSEASEA